MEKRNVQNKNGLFKVYSKVVSCGWPQKQHESYILILGGFSTGDRFEFRSVDQQERNGLFIYFLNSYFEFFQLHNAVLNLKWDNSDYTKKYIEDTKPRIQKSLTTVIDFN